MKYTYFVSFYELHSVSALCVCSRVFVCVRSHVKPTLIRPTRDLRWVSGFRWCLHRNRAPAARQRVQPRIAGTLLNVHICAWRRRSALARERARARRGTATANVPCTAGIIAKIELVPSATAVPARTAADVVYLSAIFCVGWFCQVVSVRCAM